MTSSNKQHGQGDGEKAHDIDGAKFRADFVIDPAERYFGRSKQKQEERDDHGAKTLTVGIGEGGGQLSQGAEADQPHDEHAHPVDPEKRIFF